MIKEDQAYRTKLHEKLSALGLDVQYTKAEGNYLHRKGKEEKVLDLVGAYGANLLGHAHPQLYEAMQNFLKAQVPIFAQASIREEVEALNKKLRGLFGDYSVILTNSGAETIEAAIKHAYLERPNKPYRWVVKNAFHGKSLGTLAFSSVHNEPFQQSEKHIIFIDIKDRRSWENALTKIEDTAFVLVEPILGEGGVHELPLAFIKWLNVVTKENNVPIIVDEVQTGLGRTGRLWASEALGLRPDYVCLSKALGGGIAKIGALLIHDQRFVDDFALWNTSTFSDDALSAHIACKTLDIIIEENLPARCADVGSFFKEELLKLKEWFPNIIKEIRGIGLMLGIEFHAQDQSASNLLRILSKTDYFGYTLAGHLLNVHHIRVMPTLSNPNTLRIQPSAYITKEEIRQCIHAIKATCEILDYGDAGGLLAYLVDKEVHPIQDYRRSHHYRHDQAGNWTRVAFLGHFINAKDIALWDASFQNWTEKELRRLIDRTAKMLDPIIFDQVNVCAETGKQVHLNFIGLFLDSQIIEQAYRARDFQWIVEKIQRAVEIAESAGCKALGLGGFTSILTNNGKRLHSNLLKITTGNSLTTAMGIVAVEQAAKVQQLKLAQQTVAIIGAGGNIANTYAEMLAPKVQKMLLIPRKLENPSVQKLEAKLRMLYPTLEIIRTVQYEVLKDCAVIIATSNTSYPIILPKHLSKTTKVICDIAVPTDVDEAVAITHPTIIIMKGGIIQLPEGNTFVIGGIPLPEGHVFACMGETLLMGLDEGEHFQGSIGPICAQDVQQTLALAEQYGFRLGALKMEKSF